MTSLYNIPSISNYLSSAISQQPHLTTTTMENEVIRRLLNESNCYQNNKYEVLSITTFTALNKIINIEQLLREINTKIDEQKEEKKYNEIHLNDELNYKINNILTILQYMTNNQDMFHASIDNKMISFEETLINIKKTSNIDRNHAQNDGVENKSNVLCINNNNIKHQLSDISKHSGPKYKNIGQKTWDFCDK